MLDLRELTTKEFAEIINEDVNTIKALLMDCLYLGNTDKPYYYISLNVQKSNIPSDKMEIVAKFIYTGIFNNPTHRFYDTKGYSVGLRGC